jgi:hypothetical protein
LCGRISRVLDSGAIDRLPALIRRARADTVFVDQNWETDHEAPHRAPEGEGLSEMSDADGPPGKLAEVAGLAAAIADHILEQHAAGTTIPPKQFHMLVTATRMLQDNGVPWPPSVELVLTEVARRFEQAQAAPEGTTAAPEGEEIVFHLTRSPDAVKPPEGSAE